MTNQARFNDRTITNFRSRLVGGGTRANLFECEINLPSFVKDEFDDKIDLDEDLRFMIKAAQLPGSTVGTIRVPFRGRALNIAGDRTYEPWTITIINDTNFRIRSAFEIWSNIINRNTDASGVITPSQYQKNMKVIQLGRGVEGASTIPERDATIPVLRQYKFYGCWPSDLSPIDLSYDSTDTIEEYTVTLQYQWWDPLRPDGTSDFGTTE